jgi:CRISPR-associated endonuclease Cas1
MCVVQGFGVRMSVELGHLVVRDGWGGVSRERRYSRADRHLRRVVILGHGGSISLAALQWLADVGVGFLHLDSDGRVLAASGGLGLDDPRLRRAQARSWGTPWGTAIARELLERKLRGQSRIARQLGHPDAAQRIDDLVPALGAARSSRELLIPEAAGAGIYWSTWTGVAIRWTKADVGKVPAHWRTTSGRASPISGHQRSAADPIQSLLNYCYRLGEIEARLACLAVGLDPGLGVLHADQRARDSLALDVIEPVRGEIDAYILSLLERHTFRRQDFHETRAGICRILPPLSHELASMMPTWAARLAPVVEDVARSLLLSERPLEEAPPTPLTQRKRSASRPGAGGTAPVRRGGSASPTNRCRTCGLAVVKRRAFCATCLPREMRAAGEPLAAAGRAATARLRSQGRDPTVGPAAQAARSAKMTQVREAALAWDREHPLPPDPRQFATTILPALRGISARELANKTGLSRPYCAEILKGERKPHCRWWQLLADLSKGYSRLDEAP